MYFISCLNVAEWHFWCCGWKEWHLLCSKFHGYKHKEQQPGLHPSSTECFQNYCLSSHLGKMNKNWFKIHLPLIFPARHWGCAWCWSWFCFLRTFRFVLEKWQWSKDFGFSSVGLSLEFCSLLELSSDRNSVCIFISSSLALLLFSSPSSPFFLFFPSLSSSSFTFFPVFSELKIPPTSWCSSKRMKTGEFWDPYNTVI